MSNLYLHKKKKLEFHTFKDTIILDLDNLKDNYDYEPTLLKKHPKHLKIVGKDQVDFWNYSLQFWNFPVEDITICTDLCTYCSPFYCFYNAREIIIEENVKMVTIENNIGVPKIENITIPFTINEFKNEIKQYIKNNLKSLTIYNKEDSIVIDLDKNLLGKDVKIKVVKNGECLNIKTTNDYNDIEYNVYLKDNKLAYDKKYNKYEITPTDVNIEGLNLIELRKKYNEITFKEELFVKRIIMSKSDMKYLTQNIFRLVNEIEIKDENDMSLFPRNVHIELNKKELEYIGEIEVINDSYIIKVYNSSTNKYVIINDDLSVFYLNNIERIIVDYDKNNFKCVDNVLTIPDKILRNSRKSKLLNEMIKSCRYIDDVKVSLNGKIYSVNLTKVYKNEINTSSEFKQYKKAMVRAKTHRKRR